MLTRHLPARLVVGALCSGLLLVHAPAAHAEETPAPSAAPEAPTAVPDALPAVPVIRTPKTGARFATIYIPRLGRDAWGMPIRQGIKDPQLADGFGHYPSAQMPGQPGNFAIAGHRSTHLEPMANVDRIKRGDHVIIKTDTEWLVYRLVTSKIVKPSATWVIGPTPRTMRGVPGSDRMITVTTCEPRYGSTSRWIWWGVLEEVRPLSDSPLKEIRT